ncbi:MAG: DUF2851 family protein [Bacteroidetes bacterium]|nr:DUF2851 family protein [Bacteroidota bacterium]
MKEFGLQRIWEKLAFQPQYLATDNGQPLQIINQGEWNNQNGPDFLNAEVVINGIHCFGAIEIHVNASDWYLHNHHTDPRYNGVILHVVWQNDRPCFTQSKDPIPCISIKSRVSKLNLTQFNSAPSLPCDQQITAISESLLTQQLQLALTQRTQGKMERLIHAHNQLNQDWWLTALYAFMSAWIGKANQHNCIDICKSVKKSLILRAKSEIEIIAYLLGTSGLLAITNHDVYTKSLKKTFEYQVLKFDVISLDYLQWNNRQVRPPSFAPIRLAQFGSWLFQIKGELSQFFNPPNQETIDSINKEGFQSNLSEYWDKHYELGTLSEKHNSNNGKEHAKKVILNGLIPLWNTLAKETHKPEFQIAAKQLGSAIPSETNTTTKKMSAFHRCKPPKSNSEWSQSLIAQHQLYCKSLKCAQCLIGDAIINVPFMKQES